MSYHEEYPTNGNRVNSLSERGVTMVASATSSTSSISSSSLNHPNLTTFKTLATANSNSPILTTHSSNSYNLLLPNDSSPLNRKALLKVNSSELQISHLSSVGSISTNDDDEHGNILNNEILISKIDLGEDGDEDEADESEDNDEDEEYNNEHNINIIENDESFEDIAKTDFLNRSNDDQNDFAKQFKSICIITENSSFKSDNQRRLSNFHPSLNKQNKNFEINRQSFNKTNKNQRNIEDILETSQQTISSNTNANNSINTIDTIDDELHLNNNASSSLIIASNPIHHHKQEPKSPKAFTNGSINNGKQNRSNLPSSLATTLNMNTSINSLNSTNGQNLITTATTISTSGSLGDDGSASSVVK